MSRHVLLIFGFLTSSILYAQSVELPMDYIRNKNFNSKTNSEAVQGSKYLDENFQNGKIIFNNKEIITPLRYNVLIDEFELKNIADEEVASIVRSKELKFQLGSANFAMFNYINKDGIKADGYFEILNDGPIQLLKKNNVTYNEAEPAANSYSQAKPARYVTSTEYFLAQEQQPAENISLRKKNILRVLDSQAAQGYVKDNKLKLKSETEVIQLLDYLNATK